MRGKQLALVLLLLVALGSAAWFLQRRHEASWSSSASTGGKILDFPLNDVSRITIKSGGAELNLVRKDDVWTVQERADYPANFERVGALVRKLWELRSVQDVKIGPSQLGRLQLNEPGTDANAGTLLELKANDKRLGALLLGKSQMREANQSLGAAGFPVARYALAQDGSQRVFLLSDPFTDITTKPEEWINRDFVRIENPRLITVAGTTPGMHWTIRRDNATAAWTLVDAKAGEDFDANKVANLGNFLAAGIFADVLPPNAPPNETGLDQGTTAHIETFDNFVYDLRIGKQSGMNFPVLISVKADLAKERTAAPNEKPEDKTRLDQEFQTRQKQLAEKLEKEQKFTNRPYLIAKSTIEQLTRERSALMLDKPAATPTATPSASPSPRRSKK